MAPFSGFRSVPSSPPAPSRSLSSSAGGCPEQRSRGRRGPSSHKRPAETAPRSSPAARRRCSAAPRRRLAARLVIRRPRVARVWTRWLQVWLLPARVLIFTGQWGTAYRHKREDCSMRNMLSERNSWVALSAALWLAGCGNGETPSSNSSISQNSGSCCVNSVCSCTDPTFGYCLAGLMGDPCTVDSDCCIGPTYNHCIAGKCSKCLTGQCYDGDAAHCRPLRSDDCETVNPGYGFCVAVAAGTACCGHGGADCDCCTFTAGRCDGAGLCTGGTCCNTHTCCQR